ncbi:MAG TPA: CYTH and CHAD domain-containing protein [Ideonella sp.]|uniref:CYTH and CHAD domain-containing protein n=1 Tax=Ideonella sp. TaxID=1929293 RepID=UPI002C996204|nr:CYTH and CHAD domain-containing protein [Ideonella sp.]HSI51284.1 CYTH and CHAD domain-containing protein [Ideonella sp.]
MHEIELKFQVPEARRRGLQQAFRRGRVTEQRLLAVYFDTEDRLLARHGMALRLRSEPGGWVQTLKAGNSHGPLRLEDNVALGASEAMPAPDPERHAGTPAHRRLLKAFAPAKQATLVEVFRTDVTREVRLLKGPGGLLAEAALDRGEVQAGAARHALWEIEFEWKAGPLAGLFALAADWVAQHGLWLDSVSKAERGHWLSLGKTGAPAVKARSPEVDAGLGAAAFARAAVAACLAQVLPNLSALASGDGNGSGGPGGPDHVHQLRVGLRRLRTVLREMAPLDAGLDPGWEAPLARVFGALGRLRDRQLLETQTRGALIAAGAPPLGRLQPPSQDPPLSSLLQASDFQLVLLAAQALAMQATPVTHAAYDGPPLPALAERLDHLQRQLRRDAKHFETLPPEHQHRARKRLKRLRYLAEFTAPLFRRSEVSRYFKALAPAQDCLGRLTDQMAAQAAYREAAAAQPQAWFAVGWLSAGHADAVRAARQALAQAGKAKPFWHGRLRRRQGC